MTKTYSQRWGHLNQAESIRWGNLAQMQKLITEEEEAYERTKGISHGMTKNKQQSGLLVWQKCYVLLSFAFLFSLGFCDWWNLSNL
jgi:hypothetical protein